MVTSKYVPDVCENLIKLRQGSKTEEAHTKSSKNIATKIHAKTASHTE